MRVQVALAPAERARAGIRGRAQRVGRSQVAPLADVLRAPADRHVRGVRLRRAREVDGGLREVETRLRQPDVLDRLRRRDRDEERLRVGVADVLGGEHDHPPGDEARVLAALQHRREVVDRRLHVARARRLDPGRDEVVVRVAGPCRRGAAACAPRRRRGGLDHRLRRRARSAAESSRMPSALRASPPARCGDQLLDLRLEPRRRARPRRAARPRQVARPRAARARRPARAREAPS